jgi:hypothetical protein
LVALATAKRAAASAFEQRQAAGLLRYLVAANPPLIGHIDGDMGGFGWTVTVAAAAAPTSKAPPTCSVHIDLVNRQSRRRYGISTLELCATGKSA